MMIVTDHTDSRRAVFVFCRTPDELLYSFRPMEMVLSHFPIATIISNSRHLDVPHDQGRL